MDQRRRWDYLTRVLITVAVVGVFAALFMLIWAIADILLLLFAGVLLAVVLRTLAKPFARYTPFRDQWTVVMVVLLLVIILGIGGWLFVPEVAIQTTQLVDQISVAINQLQGIIAQYPWGQWLLDRLYVEEVGQLPFFNRNLMARLTGTFTVTLRSISHLLFVLVVGFFVALDPELYRRGIVTLIPPRGRKRSREVIDSVVGGLRSWLLGQFISMVVIAIVTGVGLWMLGIPLAWLLGILSGLLEFIPIAGPILSSVPPILLAFTIGPMRAIYVALFYLVIQQLEGNLLTPIVQQQMVSLPPVITLTALLVMAFLFGPVGALIATPLAVVFFILVKMLYLEDVLGSHHQDTSPKD